MYITDEGHTYYKGASQYHSKAPFLILATRDDEKSFGPGSIRVFVRKVALQQCGHFMMGTARIFGTSVTMCGAYGNSGLTVSLPTEIWERGLPLPDDIHKMWNESEGWNSPGIEAVNMGRWARKEVLKMKGGLRKYETDCMRGGV